MCNESRTVMNYFYEIFNAHRFLLWIESLLQMLVVGGDAGRASVFIAFITESFEKNALQSRRAVNTSL